MGRYKIVVDSCCEIPKELNEKADIESVPLTLEVGDKIIVDDETFDQASFLKIVADYSGSPKSACPSPDRYMQAYQVDADRIYVVTLSSKLSGSYNSAVLGKHLMEEQDENCASIHVFDSWSASGGETQLVLKIIEFEEAGLSYDEIVEKVEEFKRNMKTYFVLDNLETLRKNGRLTGVKALVASTINIKPLMGSKEGEIIQKGQALGIKKAMKKLQDTLLAEAENLKNKNIVITHCNCFERAEELKKRILEVVQVKAIYIMDTMGVSSMYANVGGVIVTV